MPMSCFLLSSPVLDFLASVLWVGQSKTRLPSFLTKDEITLCTIDWDFGGKRSLGHHPSSLAGASPAARFPLLVPGPLRCCCCFGVRTGQSTQAHFRCQARAKPAPNNHPASPTVRTPQPNSRTITFFREALATRQGLSMQGQQPIKSLHRRVDEGQSREALVPEGQEPKSQEGREGGHH